MIKNINGLRIDITKILYYKSYAHSRGFGFKDLHIGFNDGTKELKIHTQEAHKYEMALNREFDKLDKLNTIDTDKLQEAFDTISNYMKRYKGHPLYTYQKGCNDTIQQAIDIIKEVL